MSGWCIEAVFRLPGERRRAAITRVVAGGVEIRMTDDGPEMRSRPATDLRPIGVVSAQERRWMLDAVEVLQRLDGSFAVTAEKRKAGRRWPYEITVESETAPLWVSIDRQAATLRPVRRSGLEDRDAAWRFWWRCARSFAANGCVVWDPDGDELIATSMPSAAARERYNWI